MSLYRRISVRMWGDLKFRELSAAPPNAQTLWLYLLCGEHTLAIPGVVKGGEASISETLGWPVPAFRKVFAEIHAKGMARPDWNARLVFLPNALRHNQPQSVNVVVSWAKAFEELPECALKVEIYENIKGYLEGMAEGFRKAFAVAIPEGITDAIPEAIRDTETEAGSETEVPARKTRSTKDDLESWLNDKFLPLYPEAHRADQNPMALAELRKLKPSAERLDAILASVKVWGATSKWLDEGGKFAPGPGNFFKGKLYEKTPPAVVGRNGNGGAMPDAREILQRQRETIA